MDWLVVGFAWRVAWESGGRGRSGIGERLEREESPTEVVGIESGGVWSVWSVRSGGASDTLREASGDTDIFSRFDDSCKNFF